jgi:hypothetical protein
MYINDGDDVDMAALGVSTYEDLTINAVISGLGEESVKFGVDNINSFKTESAPPYAMCGNQGADFLSCNTPAPLFPGTHTVTITVYEGNAASGGILDTVSITFKVVSPSLFEDLLINCGYTMEYIDISQRIWQPDQYNVGGTTYSDIDTQIDDTADDLIYQYERYGLEFSYEIPVPVNIYEITLHFAELYWTDVGQRIFDVSVEGNNTVQNVDILNIANGATHKVATLVFPEVVEDGFVSIRLTTSISSGIRISQNCPGLR